MFLFTMECLSSSSSRHNNKPKVILKEGWFLITGSFTQKYDRKVSEEKRRKKSSLYGGVVIYLSELSFIKDSTVHTYWYAFPIGQ